MVRAILFELVCTGFLCYFDAEAILLPTVILVAVLFGILLFLKKNKDKKILNGQYFDLISKENVIAEANQKRKLNESREK